MISNLPPIDERDSSEQCQWLHEELLQLLLITSQDLKKENLPDNGIYFFYEKGEPWGHGGNRLRIVRIGTHNDGNFRSRMLFDHYDLKEKRNSISVETTAPKDRSIFRKNIGRVLLNTPSLSYYLPVWNIKNTAKSERKANASNRDIALEKSIETEISEILETKFSFRFVELESQSDRVGKRGFESQLIGTVAHCQRCNASPNWLGRKSPIKKISEGRMWQVQLLNSPPLNEKEKTIFGTYIQKTRDKWAKIAPPVGQEVVAGKGFFLAPSR